MKSDGLGKLTDLVLIATCVILLATVGHRELKQRLNNPVKALVGATVTGLTASPNVKVNVVLVLSPDCGFCVQSIPFYRALMQTALGSGGRLVVSVKSPPKRPLGSFITQHALEGMVDAGAVDPNLRISGTPTLLLTGGDRRVVKAWVGYLDEQKQREVYASINRLCASCRFRQASTEAKSVGTQPHPRESLTAAPRAWYKEVPYRSEL